ncbi:MAG: hypothetical protein ABI702_00370 [Burkholderiales bacterium]
MFIHMSSALSSVNNPIFRWMLGVPVFCLLAAVISMALRSDLGGVLVMLMGLAFVTTVLARAFDVAREAFIRRLAPQLLVLARTAESRVDLAAPRIAAYCLKPFDVGINSPKSALIAGLTRRDTPPPISSNYC